MSRFCHSEDLVTLRVISYRAGEQYCLAYALLEIESAKPGAWHLYPLNVESGCVAPSFHADEQATNLLELNAGEALPLWLELKDTVVSAHGLFPDLVAVAWDLCITDSGVCLIEGNSGWGLITPQIVSGMPLLESGLFDAYNCH